MNKNQIKRKLKSTGIECSYNDFQYEGVAIRSYHVPPYILNINYLVYVLQRLESYTNKDETTFWEIIRGQKYE